MIMRQRIVGIQPEDAFVFSDGLINAAQLKVCVGETIFKRIGVPNRRSVAYRLSERLNGFSCAPTLESEITAALRSSRTRPLAPRSIAGLDSINCSYFSAATRSPRSRASINSWLTPILSYFERVRPSLVRNPKAVFNVDPLVHTSPKMTRASA